MDFEWTVACFSSLWSLDCFGDEFGVVALNFEDEIIHCGLCLLVAKWNELPFGHENEMCARDV